LDWNDFLDPVKSESHGKYNTVIACDCAYLHTHTEALSKTLSGLLHDDLSSKIHLVGPYNRSAMHEVIRYLQDSLQLDVLIEMIEMNRYRLKPVHNHCRESKVPSVDECAYASKSNVKFLHVTASHKTEKRVECLQDID
jgi:hypothetical protein